MARMLLTTIFFVAAISVSSAQTPYKPNADELRAAYVRANEYQKRVENAALNLTIKCTWFDSGKSFWYRRELPGQMKEFIRVSSVDGKKEQAFDHAKLAAGISLTLGKSMDAKRLPFNEFQYAVDGKSIEFQVESQGYRASLDDYKVEKDANTVGFIPIPWSMIFMAGINTWPLLPDPDAVLQPTHVKLAEIQPQQTRQLPYTARIQEGQIQVRKQGSEEWSTLSKAGGYTKLEWSPDGKKMIAFRLLPGEHKKVYLLKSSLPGTTRAGLEERLYDQPGDKMDSYETYILDPEAKTETKSDLDPVMGGGQPWAGDPGVTWWYGKPLLDFPIRGYQEYKVVTIDLDSAKAKTLIDEKSPTFIDTTKTMLRPLPDGKHLIWRSERDGWSHLYMVDSDSGEFRQITKGPWVVRGIERVDNQAETVWFTTNGVDPKQDPYHIHYCRIKFDGTGFQDLTPGDGTHTVQFSPDRKVFVDTYSRVDSAPIHELRQASDGKLLSVIEKSDIGGLLKNGIPLPERFVAKARDGKTDIWGIVVRPSNFDLKKKYPVIENIYAGPHDSFVPKAFRPFLNMNRLAELGFIVVQIDGMGTSNRGKAFHDVCWKNIADAGFPDRILWMKALAAKYPQVDIDRVGIFGTSAGGQNSTAGILYHPEFYKAAVSSCGCHDNRIDKQWWNEQWMGYPVGPEYAAQSNITNAKNLQGKLLLIVGENDRNVPPETTFRLADALIKAQKEFDLVVIPGADHTDGGPYGERKRRDFFVRNLLGVDPPVWNH
jgi:dienelactone hydrolase